MENNVRTITDFLNTEYLEYSRYTVEERAIPSLCDGFKPGARKIMHAANEGTIKDGKTYKLLVLSGDTMNKSQYAHGDGSLNGTITEKAKDFVNNLNAIEIEGQGGSLRNPDAVGSPRYLYVRKSKYMDLIYKTDYDLLEYVFDEGMYLEPKQYYPIIPTVLTSMAMGIANGYSFHTMAYNPVNLLDCCSEELSNGNQKTLITPFLRGISPDSWRYIDGKWWSYGKWKVNQSKDMLIIEDLPYDVTYEDFEKLLNKYQEKNIIKDYKNLSEDGNIRYEIQFYPRQLSQELKKDDTGLSFSTKFKLVKAIPEDLLWVLDEKHKLKYFATHNELIKYFVNWRLSIYASRKKKLVKILNEKYKNNSDICKFIDLVIHDKIKINNRPKIEIKKDLKTFDLPDSMLSIPISKLTKEEYEALLKENEEIKKELEYIINTTEKQMYLDDLKKLRKELEKEFPVSSNVNGSNIKIEIIGEAKKTKEDKEIDKINKEKAKEKLEKEKAKKVREKEKAKKDKDKIKKQREIERANKEKIKLHKKKLIEKINKQKEIIEKIKKQNEAARLKGNKEEMKSLREKYLAAKEVINTLKAELANK